MKLHYRSSCKCRWCRPLPSFYTTAFVLDSASTPFYIFIKRFLCLYATKEWLTILFVATLHTTGSLNRILAKRKQNNENETNRRKTNKVSNNRKYFAMHKFMFFYLHEFFLFYTILKASNNNM